MAWHDAASLDDIRRARPWLPVTVGGIEIVVMGLEGAWYGLEDRCAHAGCAFSKDGGLLGSIVICDCHGSEYDIRTGAVRRGPAEQSIRTIPVRVSGDRLEVDV